MSVAKHEMTSTNVALINALETRGKYQELKRGGLLYYKGLPADRLYVVTSGVIYTQREGPGARYLLDTVASPGHILGIESLEPGSFYRATAKATETSEVLVIRRNALLETMRGNPDLTIVFMEGVDRQVGAQEEYLHIIKMGTPKEKMQKARTDLPADATAVALAARAGYERTHVSKRRMHKM